MNKDQNNLLTTGHAVSAMLETLTAASLPPALAAARTALETLLEEINTTGDQQANPLPPRTRERNRQLEAAARAAHVIARLVHGHALASGSVALAGQVDCSVSDLLHGRLNRRLQYMRQVHAAASAWAAELGDAGVTPALLTDLAEKIATAEAGLALPRSNIATRRVATESLARAFERLERLLRFTLDPLVDTLQSVDPDAYTRYQTARQVIDRSGAPSVDLDAPPKANPNLAPAPLAPQPLAA